VTRPENDDLDSLVRAELTREPIPAAVRIADAIVSRHGESVAAVLFYGSCLRRGTSEGVLDFYVLVDSYRSAYGGASFGSRMLAWANEVLPPNVFYLELGASELGASELEAGAVEAGETLRSKYAVVSTEDFARGSAPGGVRSSIWARFCQPTLAVHTRDATCLAAAVSAVSRSILTAVETTLPLLPDADGVRRFTAAELWQGVLQQTYAAEMRTEAPESIDGLYEADPERYQRVTAAALASLAQGGAFELARDGASFEISGLQASPAGPRFAVSRRLAAKAVYLLGLLKSAFTFGDWLPYVLWKLERHTGTRIVPTERQRRRPLIWGWPILFRVLWRRDLR
jgi:hypothetical protein